MQTSMKDNIVEFITVYNCGFHIISVAVHTQVYIHVVRYLLYTLYAVTKTKSIVLGKKSVMSQICNKVVGPAFNLNNYTFICMNIQFKLKVFPIITSLRFAFDG